MKLSMSDLSTMTGLTTRTLRNYLSLGILNGAKEDGKWVFSDEDFNNFLSDETVKHTLESKRLGIIFDTFNGYADESASIINLKVKNSEEFASKLMAKIDDYPEVRFKLTIRDGIAKIAYSANLEENIAILQFIQTLK